ncbi:ABC transporter ATP-binding protein [Glycomyces artemisiae]|uniref:ABC-2 type transport system ATP-binding protein n=1 Tax=Glycomyces artemisiae TaxID=1076443 RepID=A0A2T0UG19_9ACTN|nr:ABC transporter ATP-binding protein [Glycomyces artemisiae]PRY56903.1 ABC-2 type transport system ATP-binding protein [Glycomyces artemisiae]
MNTPVIATNALTKRYGPHAALTDVTLDIPAGRIVGLVGPNGAGKSTLLALAAGLIRPTAGTIDVLGNRPAADAAQLARVGFVAQDTPVYAQLTVADHLRLGEKLNPRWDAKLADERLRQTGLDPAKKAGRLSGGQKAQLALTLAAAKRPDLMIFDEPVAALDPLARRSFLQSLMEFVADMDVSVLLSSHLIADVERVCDHLVILAESRVQVAGEIDDLTAAHHRIVGPRGALDQLPPGVDVVAADHTDRQTTLIVHNTAGAPLDLPGAEPIGLEDMVLTYLHRAEGLAAPILQETAR